MSILKQVSEVIYTAYTKYLEDTPVDRAISPSERRRLSIILANAAIEELDRLAIERSLLKPDRYE